MMAAVPPSETLPTARASAWYHATVERFLESSPEEVLGTLAGASGFGIEREQRDAWQGTIALLRDSLAGVDGWLFLEFHVPRLGSRIDAVVVSAGLIIPIEFKVGQPKVGQGDRDQVWDYALDLRNFHAASHTPPLYPVIVATAASTADSAWQPAAPDGVYPPRAITPDALGAELRALVQASTHPMLDGESWVRAAYAPTPGIVEAARSLFARHTVADITKRGADGPNLGVTVRRIGDIIDAAQREHRKAIVFVTGVPGAGKTLVGLELATARRDHAAAGRAVYLSGNGPLVAVLREALTRDEVARQKLAGKRPRKGDVAQPIKAFIQNVHHFRDDGLRDVAAPHDHVVIFDEAQRAWTRAKTSDFMRRRKGVQGFDRSEPEFLIEYLDRHAGWAVIICLVGGGQEIHDGEAGIGAWLEAARDRFPHWTMHIAPELADREYQAETVLASMQQSNRLRSDPALHLSTSMRSFRASGVSAFVKALLDHDRALARDRLRDVSARYPLFMTRDLSAAKRWVRTQARGTERFGMVASSQAMRLKPHAIDVRVAVDPVHWFLGERSHTRSSWYLEEAATEFQVQGLELDWCCVTWDADLRSGTQGWHYGFFRGDRWVRAHTAEKQRNLLNAYRVLLTRARQGMVLFVPPGDPADPTRRPEYYDETWQYLAAVGVPQL
jgi:hypothetical protein